MQAEGLRCDLYVPFYIDFNEAQRRGGAEARRSQRRRRDELNYLAKLCAILCELCFFAFRVLFLHDFLVTSSSTPVRSFAC